MKMKMKISEIKHDFQEWASFAIGVSPLLGSLVSYTKESPSLISVIMALEKTGYEIEYA